MLNLFDLDIFLIIMIDGCNYKFDQFFNKNGMVTRKNVLTDIVNMKTGPF